ncbi:MAG: helix-hairpin-helix domain-containing protein [Candidatus Omnitrophica bacterium]|nr:helix-hairpin-helix domain-containing protein [Candidatus Omnitrophota bacterium]
MLNLTQEERRVVVFLLTVVLVGMGINFCLKLNHKVRRVLCVDESLARINLNQVTLPQLLRIRCIPKKIAEKIIEYRFTNGSYGQVEELKQVKGLGEKRFNKLKDLFFVK